MRTEQLMCWHNDLNGWTRHVSFPYWELRPLQLYHNMSWSLCWAHIRLTRAGGFCKWRCLQARRSLRAHRGLQIMRNSTSMPSAIENAQGNRTCNRAGETHEREQ